MPTDSIQPKESAVASLQGGASWGKAVNLLPYLVLTLSLLMTLFFWRQYDRSLTSRFQTAFQDRTEEIMARFLNRMIDNEQVLRGAVGLFNASDQVTRDEWHRYAISLSLERNYPGLQGLGFSEVVHPKDRERHIRRMQAEGFPSYRIWPEGKRPVYTAIVYLEPFDWRNQRAFGYDMFSEPNRHDAMVMACDTGDAALTNPVFLVQETERDRQKGVLMYLPVYDRMLPTATLEQRRDALKGYAYSPIRIRDFMWATFPRPPQDIGFRIYTESRATASAMLFDSVSDWKVNLPRNYRPDFRASHTVKKFGREWLFTFQSLPNFALEQGKDQSRSYLAGGLVVSALLTVIAFMLRNAHTSAIRAAQALRESQERYRKISEDSPAYICTFLPDCTLTYVNPALAKNARRAQADLEGRNFLDFLLPEYRLPVQEALNDLTPEQPTETMELAIFGPGGGVIWHQWTNRGIFDEQGRLAEVQAVGQDITERKKAEEERLRYEQQLLHAQKMESLGVLAGGIAHDFNNILMAIIGNVDLSLMKLPEESPVAENLRNIETAANRAAYLAKQMLAYSGKGRFMIEQTDLNRLIEELRHVLETAAPNAELKLDLARPLPAVEADQNQIRQILMNLVQNAAEAIGDQKGEIIIRTGSAILDQESLKNLILGESMAEGRYVFLEVFDTGAGMEEEVLKKIFDPFFTTKFTGRGLGLAAVHGIARGHQGGIRIYSEPGRGTTFKVLLPATEAAEAVAAEPVLDDWRGEGKILLVDDEETVRSIGIRMLRELGFTPLTASGGEEALSLYRENPDIKAVLLDLTMPGMDGEEAFRQLQLIDPKVRVVMSSGFSQQDVVQKFDGKGLVGFIQKPYTLKVLREVMRKAP
ncbi:CHASE domain-containing protein [Geomonas sp. Red69]|uniref:CHASE domain-containing protein n=1 Tax=Geomonas diazotrophica TaxID=2843197 RepID=UPI001C10BEE4|nr:CHASE domain-containing protein [Geomonas diazotrophica]MBU5638744.1 CHASE domain-containing protein [Geomonas diazotrophica]